MSADNLIYIWHKENGPWIIWLDYASTENPKPNCTSVEVWTAEKALNEAQDLSEKRHCEYGIHFLRGKILNQGEPT